MSSSGGYFEAGRPGWVARNLNESARATAILETTAHLVEADINRRSPTAKVRWRVSGGARPSVLGPFVRIATSSSIWHIIEFGSAKYGGVRSPAYRLLSRAADALGLVWRAE